MDGAGILLELVNVLSSAEISGIELTQTSAGVATPTVNLSYSSDGGVNWTPIPGASTLTMDNLGRGSFDWAVPAGLPSGNYLIKVTSNDFAGVSDTSDGTFLLANSGHSITSMTTPRREINTPRPWAMTPTTARAPPPR